MCACPVTWTAWQCLRALKARGRVHHIGFIPHWGLTSAVELAQRQEAVALFTLSHGHIRKCSKKTHKRTLSLSPLSHPPPSCLSISLFYTSVTSAFLLCSLCQFPFHATSRKSVQVNISRLLMLKGSDSGRYVTGRELPVPRAATDKTRTIVFPRCFYLIKQQICVIGRRHFALHLHYSSSFSEGTPATRGENKALIVM